LICGGYFPSSYLLEIFSSGAFLMRFWKTALLCLRLLAIVAFSSFMPSFVDLPRVLFFPSLLVPSSFSRSSFWVDFSR